MISYHSVTDRARLDQVAALEQLVWGMEPQDTISAHTLMVLQHIGGGSIGAFDGERMVGCTIAFPHQDGRLWSHVAAVHPDYQGRGIGLGLKQAQRTWALTQGYRTMSWSFDPLMRRNAHFNLCLLGASTNRYVENLYGAMHDRINRGLPSDRFEMFWFLEGAAAIERPDSAPFILTADAAQTPMNHAITPDADWLFVQIPYAFDAIKENDLALATAWVLALRVALQSAFAAGYWAVDFITHRDKQQCWYALYRRDHHTSR